MLLFKTLKLLFTTFITQHWHTRRERFPQSSIEHFSNEMFLNYELFKYFFPPKVYQ